MTLPYRRHRERRLARAGGFPDTGETSAQILARTRPPSYDARPVPFTGASAAGQPDTEPLPRLRAPDPRETGPMQRLPRIERVRERPRPARPADAAIFTWSSLISQHIMLCGVCLRSRHADPVAAHLPFTFEALRVSAYQAGWRLDRFARWACPACQMTAAYWAPHPVIHWDPDAAAAYGTADERKYRDAAEHDLILDVADSATRYRHAGGTS